VAVKELDTTVFGKIEIEEERIIRFPHGLPGFEDHRSYILIPLEEDVPFSYLQSLDNPELSFLVTSPFYFYGNYEVVLSESLREDLQIVSEDQVVIVTVASVRDSLDSATINLLAPIIINLDTLLGKQIILHDSPYTTKHRLLTAPVEGE
jgi:flagellar assembly factor FliW